MWAILLIVLKQGGNETKSLDFHLLLPSLISLQSFPFAEPGSQEQKSQVMLSLELSLSKHWEEQ